MLFVAERRQRRWLTKRDPRGASTSERSSQTQRIARRRAEEKRGDTLFVAERRRRRWLTKRDPRGASTSERSSQTQRTTLMLNSGRPS